MMHYFPLGMKTSKNNDNNIPHSILFIVVQSKIEVNSSFDGRLINVKN